jgi:hypothetical protein
MSAEPVYLAGRPVTAFTGEDDLKAYLKRCAARSRGRWSTESTAPDTRQ